MSITNQITKQVLDTYPKTLAIYLFGSFATKYQTDQSDVDIALLFDPVSAKRIGSLSMSSLRFKLETLLLRDVDLINLQLVNSVFQKEIIMDDRCIFGENTFEMRHFEMLVLSKYQKLNEERREIIADAMRNGSFY